MEESFGEDRKAWAEKIYLTKQFVFAATTIKTFYISIGNRHPKMINIAGKNKADFSRNDKLFIWNFLLKKIRFLMTFEDACRMPADSFVIYASLSSYPNGSFDDSEINRQNTRKDK